MRLPYYAIYGDFPEDISANGLEGTQAHVTDCFPADLFTAEHFDKIGIVVDEENNIEARDVSVTVAETAIVLGLL